MEEALGILGYARLRWVRELLVEVNGSSGNSSIVTQSAPNGNHTHTHTHINIFDLHQHPALHLFIANFQLCVHRATVVLGDQD